MLDKTEYTVEYRNVKHPRLEFKTGTLLVILPKSHTNEKEILKKYKKWIRKKELTIRTALEEANTQNLNNDRTDKELRNIVHKLAQDQQRELDTRIGKIYFRRMKTKWASHSHNNNLTINTLLKYLPEDLIEYVIFHELVHSKRGRKHDESFWRTVNIKFKNHAEKEGQLLVYWFLIHKTGRESRSHQKVPQ
jgi:hypothetical protein